MFKKTLFTLLLSVAVSHAAIRELIPKLMSDNLDTQTQARLDLLAECSRVSAPGMATGVREAICMEMCQELKRDHPVESVLRPLLNNLERIGAQESVATLEKLLDHDDEHVRDDARRALAVNPSSKADRVLGERLRSRKSRPAKVTAGLITALSEREVAGASNLIARYVKSKDDEIFLAAVKALGRLNEDIGVTALAKARAGAKGFRKTQIDAALLSMNRNKITYGVHDTSTDQEMRAAALMMLILAGDIDLAKESMNSGESAKQLAVIEAALQSKSKAVYQLVAAKLGGLPPHLQSQALTALEFSGERSFAKAVEPMLESADVFVQDNAARALARMGTAKSVPALIANGRGDARRALGMLNAKGVDDALEKVAARGDAAARAMAIDALANRRRSDLIPVFFKIAAKEKGATATAAARAIGSLGDDSSIKPLLKLMISREKDSVSRDALGAIVTITRRSTEQSKVVEALVRQLKGASPRSQANILSALVQTESQDALAPLAKACRSHDEKLQKSAVKMLSGWKRDNGLPIMIALMENKSLSTVNHVVMTQGVTRLLAQQRQLDKKLAKKAFDACRREEERSKIEEIIDKAD